MPSKSTGFVDPTQRKSPHLQAPFAQGAYGCIMKKPLPCKKMSARDSNLGKLASQKNAAHEVEVSNELALIPNVDMYFVRARDADCSKEELDTYYTQYKGTCEFLNTIQEKNLDQVLTPYAGVTVRGYPFKASFPFLAQLTHCLTGLKELHAIGYGHFDIHSANILIDSKGVMRFIDFGKSYKGDSMTADDVSHFKYPFTPEFNWQPPEFALMNAIQKGIGQEEAIRMVLEKKGSFRLVESILGLRVETQSAELQEFWKYSSSAQEKDWVLFFKLYWRKLDVWALGVVFLEILNLLFHHESFVKEVWPRESVRITAVLKGMLQANPRERFSMEQCLAALASAPAAPPAAAS
jgi:serine/threonine protein kinase